MADRIMTWHVPDVPFPVSLPRYYADADFQKDALRVYADIAPVEGDLEIDIRADGVSIFQNQPSYSFTTDGQRINTPTSTAVLIKGENEELDGEDFNDGSIEEGAWVTCHIENARGAKGITIQLELTKVGQETEV